MPMDFRADLTISQNVTRPNIRFPIAQSCGYSVIPPEYDIIDLADTYVLMEGFYG